ncbi:hypothetical protein MKW94_002985 [Papaver nudicaule]|uniref:Uncharacterized protein n=1 Tax=Papaver nudicaule TaxID=74823 RepID=A0AA41SLF8_PAPNU|nr:hypothetical protein [Papaver nudicaule]MCL7036293.1 hypothetical protein [Papaver nudicaule]
MDALSGNSGGFWWKFHFNSKRARNSNSRRNSQSGGSNGGGGGSGRINYRFPLKQAVTATCLALTGDTIAQVTTHFKDLNRNDDKNNKKEILSSLLSKHDWLRSLRMSTYGFFLYGPGSHAWYQYLDYSLPQQTVQNFLLKVTLNQVVLGPIVIAVVFAWNNLWVGKLKELPNKYQKDALPTLLYGFRFWIPVSVLNFWLVPLQTRVGFMSTASIFWNFYLSSTMSK